MVLVYFSAIPSPLTKARREATSYIPINKKYFLPTGGQKPCNEYHRGPKVDPRWPVENQVFLGPIPVSVTWEEIRNTFYAKVYFVCPQKKLGGGGGRM